MYFGLVNNTLVGFEIVTSSPPMVRVVDSPNEERLIEKLHLARLDRVLRTDDQQAVALDPSLE